jgi:D-tyrosyl-tRNA(Tyr) deacylase
VRVLIQRVARASVAVADRHLGAIERGLLLFVGIGAEDEADAGAALSPMAAKVLGLRIFAADEHRMNRSVADIGGGLLVVSQFTLHADCRKGRRPSFTAAARPETARALFDRFVELLKASGLHIQTGEFGAMMNVDLVNDGPVTIWLDSAECVR